MHTTTSVRYARGAAAAVAKPSCHKSMFGT